MKIILCLSTIFYLFLVSIFPISAQTPFPNNLKSQAIYLDGASYLITNTQKPAFDVDSDFTIEAYIQFDPITSSLQSVQNILTSYPGSQEPQSYTFSINQTGPYNNEKSYIAFDIDRSVDSPNYDFSLGFSGKTELLASRWYHVAIVRTGDSFTLYVDGISDNTITKNQGDIFINNGDQLVVGAGWGSYNANPDYRFKGKIDELHISSKARYLDNFTPPNHQFTPDINTIALWHFNGDFTDSSDNKYTLTSQGSPQFVEGIVEIGKSGDINNDNIVNLADLSTLLSNFGKQTITGDINMDGNVNLTDLAILLANFGN